MIRILKALTIVAGLALFVPAGAAVEQMAQEAPDVLVRRITREVMESVRTDPAIKSGDLTRIHELIDTKILPHLDVRRATSIAVGPYWRTATPQQKEELTDEFRSLLMHTYAGAMSKIGDQKLVFQPLRAKPDDTEAEVRFLVERPQRGEPVQVSYRLHKSPDGWKVYDVNVLGVWLVQTYKSTFSAEIHRGGIEGLIQALADKNSNLAAQATGN